MMKGLAWFLGWTALLAFALFFPVSKIIWVMSVRRLERRLGRPQNEAERIGQRGRARLIAFLLVLIFAALFNYKLFGIPVL